VVTLREGESFGRFDLTMYRFHLTDLIPFYNSIRFGIMHGGINNVPVTYSSLAFYYAIDKASLVLSDKLDIGNREEESSHQYQAEGDLGQVQTLIAYFEGDNDGSIVGEFEEPSLAKQTPERAEYLVLKMVLNPPDTPLPEESAESVTDDGRSVTSTHQFVASIDPKNNGVKLRRRFDQSTGRQKARVSVDGENAGIWYYAGSNLHKKWREDDFEIHPKFTKDKSQITIKIEPLSETWNEFYYWVFSDQGGK
jgi:hypothetical protein